MRVCVVTTVHKPWDGRIFYRQARTLAAAGFEVFLLHRSGLPDEERCGVQAIGLRPPSNRLARALGAFKMVRRALAMRADVVHVHDPELLIPGVILCKLRRVKFVYDIHEDYIGMIGYKEWIPRPFRWLVTACVGFMEWAFVRMADGVVVADAQLGERFRRINPRTVVAHNFPPADVFTPPREGERDEILYEGGISPVRGAYVMLDAVERLKERFPKIALTLLGPVHAEEDRVRKRVEELGPETARIEEAVAYEELPSRIAGAKVGLVLWQRTRKNLINMPTKIFDYMAAGVPYVASDFPHIGKLVGEVGGRLVDPGDVDAVIDAVSDLLERDDVRHAIGQRGRWAFERRYCWEKESRRLLKLYRKIEDLVGR